MDRHIDRRQTPARDVPPVAALCEQPMRPYPTRNGVQVPISAESYTRLLSLADQAPLDALALTDRTLARAKTLGYNLIGQVRCTTPNRLVADFGVEPADELLRALFAFGLSQQDPTDRDVAE